MSLYQPCNGHFTVPIPRGDRAIEILGGTRKKYIQLNISATCTFINGTYCIPIFIFKKNTFSNKIMFTCIKAHVQSLLDFILLYTLIDPIRTLEGWPDPDDTLHLT